MKDHHLSAIFLNLILISGITFSFTYGNMILAYGQGNISSSSMLDVNTINQLNGNQDQSNSGTTRQGAQTMNQSYGGQDSQFAQCVDAGQLSNLCKGPNATCVSAKDLVVACNLEEWDKLVNNGRNSIIALKNNETQLNYSSINNTDIISTREKLIDKVSTVQDLDTILNKFRDFVNVYSNSDNSNIATNGNKTIATSNLGSTHIYYSINPQYAVNPEQIVKGNYSIMMLKFTDLNKNILNNPLNYKITIKDPIDNRIIFTKSVFTNNGADLQVIDENAFSKGEVGNPIYYQMWINIISIDGKAVNEKTNLPILLKVV